MSKPAVLRQCWARQQDGLGCRPDSCGTGVDEIPAWRREWSERRGRGSRTRALNSRHASPCCQRQLKGTEAVLFTGQKQALGIDRSESIRPLWTSLSDHMELVSRCRTSEEQVHHRTRQKTEQVHLRSNLWNGATSKGSWMTKSSCCPTHQMKIHAQLSMTRPRHGTVVKRMTSTWHG